MPSLELREALRSYFDRGQTVNGLPLGHVSCWGQSKWAIPAWDLPTGLRRFADMYGGYLFLPSGDELMRKHTLAPYFLSTLPTYRQEPFIARLIEFQPGPRRPLLPVALTEWMSPSPVLCPECDEVWQELHGFSIVQRHWVLPFATRCSLHGEPLVQYPEWSPVGRGKGRKHEFRPMRRLQGIAFSSIEQVTLESGHSLLEELGQLLLSRGFTTRSGRIRRQALCEALAAHARGRYEHAQLDHMLANQSSVSKLLTAVWNPRACLHPAVACALLLALRDCPEVTQTQLLPAKRIDKCEALAAALALSTSLTEAARQAGVSVTTAAVHARSLGWNFAARPKTVDEEKRAQIEQLLLAGEEIVAACRKANVSTVTVYRVLNANPQLKNARRLAQKEGGIAARRATWVKLIEGHPFASRKELRALAPAQYAFLYRRDREWLALHPPGRARGPRSRAVRTLRSPPGAAQALAERLQLVKAQDAMELPPRLTQTRLLKLAGRPNQSNVQRYPQLLAELERATESLNTFVRRRISAAICRLHNSNEAVTVLCVERECGLRPETILRSGVRIEDVMASTRTSNAYMRKA